MSLRMHLGYWTIFHGEEPVISYATFMDAWSALYACYAGFTHIPHEGVCKS